MQYEVNVDEISSLVIALWVEKIDKGAKTFGTYKTTKIKMLMQTKVPKMERKRKKMIANLEGKLGEAPLQTAKGKLEDEETMENEEDESKGKELVVPSLKHQNKRLL